MVYGEQSLQEMNPAGGRVGAARPVSPLCPPAVPELCTCLSTNTVLSGCNLHAVTCDFKFWHTVHRAEQFVWNVVLCAAWYFIYLGTAVF